MSDQSLLDGVDNGARLKVEKSTLAPGGLGLTTAVAIAELDHVFFEPQLLHLADNNHFDSTCDGCFMWLEDSVNLQTRTINVEGVWPTLKKCSGCEVVRYCSKSCQRKAWKSHHKAECKIYAEEHIEDVIVRATIRLLCMRKLGTLNDNQWHWVNRMQSHVEDYNRSDPEFGRTISEAASGALEWTGMGGSEEYIRELFCRISLNHMADARMEGEIVGITLDPLAAVMNHSCEPNAFCVLEGANIRVRSLRPIKVDEEITIAYTDVTLSRDARREKLSRWFFDCECKKCSKNEFDDVVKVPVGCDPAALSAATLELDFHNPQKGDSAVFGPGAPGAGWQASLQPIPNLHTHLATAWRAKTLFSDPATSHEVQLNLLNELRHRLALCLVGDPAVRPLKEHPRRIENLFMLVKLLRKIFFVQQDPFAFPGFAIERAEIGMFYRYCMLMVCRGASTSHGKESPFAVAVNDWMKWEIQVVGNPATVLGNMQAEETQVALTQVIAKLLRWSGVPMDE